MTDFNSIPPIPKGMVVMPAPEGFNGFYFAPAPDMLITVRHIAQYLQRITLPPAMTGAIGVWAEAWRLLPFFEFHISRQGDDQHAEVDVEALLMTEDCPASLVYVFWPFSRRLEAIRNPKLSAEPSNII